MTLKQDASSTRSACGSILVYKFPDRRLRTAHHDPVFIAFRRESSIVLSSHLTLLPLGGLLVIVAADAMGPEKVVIAVREEHIAAFARSSTGRVVLNIVCSNAADFCCCCVEFDLINVTPERAEIEVVVATHSDQIWINYESRYNSAFMTFEFNGLGSLTRIVCLPLLRSDSDGPLVCPSPRFHCRASRKANSTDLAPECAHRIVQEVLITNKMHIRSPRILPPRIVDRTAISQHKSLQCPWSGKRARGRNLDSCASVELEVFPVAGSLNDGRVVRPARTSARSWI